MGRKTTVKIILATKKTRIWVRKENIKREIESLLIATQNNSIKASYVKGRIDKTQQNNKCRLCGDHI